MAMRTKVTLENDHTRRVIIFALWRIASVNVVGNDNLSDGFYDKAWAEIHPAYVPGENPGEAEHRLIRLRAVQNAARAVSDAALGERVPLPVRWVEFDDALRDFLRAVDQNEELLEGLPEAEQEDIMACRGAAAHLLWELEERVAPPPLLPPDFADPPEVYRTELLPN